MFTLTLRQVGVVNPMDMQYIQFYNIMIRKVMEKMNLTEVKRNYYDAEVSWTDSWAACLSDHPSVVYFITSH